MFFFEDNSTPSPYWNKGEPRRGQSASGRCVSFDWTFWLFWSGLRIGGFSCWRFHGKKASNFCRSPPLTGVEDNPFGSFVEFVDSMMIQFIDSLHDVADIDSMHGHESGETILKLRLKIRWLIRGSFECKFRRISIQCAPGGEIGPKGVRSSGGLW